ncbi:MAG: hypothetical protein H0X51_04985 [Parachlamydiaceae bacterium]|nr:hypothetical protein [Parachlamydiaceae bacterium]
MSIPYNDNLTWANYTKNPAWGQTKEPVPGTTPSFGFGNVLKEPCVSTVQFVRDALRLVLKVPCRAAYKPICMSKNWRELDRAKINVKLTGYSLAQLVSLPIHFLVTIVALVTFPFSREKSNWLLDISEGLKAHLDGRASQLEALKEQGAKTAKTRNDYEQYRIWLYNIPAPLCRRTKES